eukprot:TRINITY_DN22605_c0_g2_i1.p1 TRINITY_DN22605_c0_g2~~TRINITY_DN22605_c0_g2_i1.p1  ORF type:complete len:465 (-),score=102.51 TRINITY_DN22605_c0_g2_i1:101-1495(-)
MACTGRSVNWADLLDETIAIVLEHLNATVQSAPRTWARERSGSARVGAPPCEVTAAARVCKAWQAPARADRVWIPLCRLRWRFGRTYGEAAPALADEDKTPAPPGARDEYSLASWHAAISRGAIVADGAFRYYVERAKGDSEVRAMVKSIKHDSESSAKDAVKKKLLDRGQEALDELISTTAESKEGPPEARLVRLALTNQWAVGNWQKLLAQEAKAETLEEGGLVLAQWWSPAEDVVPFVRSTLERLEQLARQRLAGQVLGSISLDEKPTREDAVKIIKAVNGSLFDDFGLHGNVGNYYDPENSFLHTVLQRRRGIPISLSIVWAAVARRLGMQACLLAKFPCHVFIRVPIRPEGEKDMDAAARDLYIDAFERGELRDWRAMQETSAQVLRQPISPNQLRQFVAVCPPVDIYSRCLRNLQNIFSDNQDTGLLWGCCEQLGALGDPQMTMLSERIRRMYSIPSF